MLDKRGQRECAGQSGRHGRYNRDRDHLSRKAGTTGDAPARSTGYEVGIGDQLEQSNVYNPVGIVLTTHDMHGLSSRDVTLSVLIDRVDVGMTSCPWRLTPLPSARPARRIHRDHGGGVALA